MSSSAPLTETEAREFVAQWFHNLDIHVPLETFLAMVADEGIEFRFPEVTVTDKAGLTDWYNRVTRTFFNEIHETKKLDITTENDQATVRLLTHWTADTWDPPAAKSKQIVFLADQTWQLKRSPKTGQAVVVAYIVNSFDPVGDSGPLPVKDTATV
jgi:hypothetical protein